MADKHLYEFCSAGFYAAESKEDAFRLMNTDVGFDEAEADFVREVPDDELLEICGEESDDDFHDPRQERRPLTRKGVPLEGEQSLRWFLKAPAREWANSLTHGEGYVFGGDC